MRHGMLPYDEVEQWLHLLVWILELISKHTLISVTVQGKYQLGSESAYKEDRVDQDMLLRLM